ncbi:disulfide bond formation protein DsbB [Helicobacter sp. 13S00401-1]|uniref:disulfide bond formation protein B n=1 Tax=Helicobacter sp. 13S00401-1 TaxID=1905758 RepID=UPI000BA6C60A|nr:disulfide bond formation protein B [Helicobacter sp. 13S00401-1]PAF51401.1 disulfide bond formation protein DsbB [Helicobacter sp. 13S00401-1]
MQKTTTFYVLLSLAVIGILALPVGIANFIFGYVFGDSPCILCWGQRQSMIYISIAVLFILRYGFKPKYLAMLLVITAFALWESFYHLGSHATQDIGQGFGLAIFSLHTQFWAEVVFWAVVLLLGIIFFFAPSLKTFVNEMGEAKFRKLTVMNIIAFWVFFIVIISNIIQAFVSSGPPPFVGQGDPVRYSWNPKYTIWSMESWSDMRWPVHFLGKRGVNLPVLADSKDAKFDANYADSPLVVNEVLKVDSKRKSTLKLNSPISDLNYQNGKMLVSTQNYGLYITDKNLDSISSYFVLDNYFSSTIEKFVGANFIDGHIRVTGMNKANVDVKENPHANKVANFRYFIKGADKFDELGKYNLKTSRASSYYVLSARSDGTHTYMMTVPNNLYKKLIVISTLDSDKGLAAEYTPTLGEGVSLKAKRSLGELYITAMAYKDGKLYAASKAYNTLILLDPKSGEIVKTYGIPKEVANISAMTFIGDKLLVSSYEDSKDVLYTLEF